MLTRNVSVSIAGSTTPQIVLTPSFQHSDLVNIFKSVIVSIDEEIHPMIEALLRSLLRSLSFWPARPRTECPMSSLAVIVRAIRILDTCLRAGAYAAPSLLDNGVLVTMFNNGCFESFWE